MGLAKEKIAEEGVSARVVSPTGHGVEADSRLKEMVRISADESSGSSYRLLKQARGVTGVQAGTH